MKFDLTSLRKLFSGLYKRCECGCGVLIPVINKHRHVFARYKSGHNSKGEKHPMWKGGRHKSGGYWNLRCIKHHRPISGEIREHVVLYEKYYKVCMLKWGVVHHINGKKDDNRIENLQGMTEKEHLRIHHRGNKNNYGKHKDTSHVRCYNCDSVVTRMKKLDKTHKTPYPIWNHLPYDKINYYCCRCYEKLRNLSR